MSMDWTGLSTMLIGYTDQSCIHILLQTGNLSGQKKVGYIILHQYKLVKKFFQNQRGPARVDPFLTNHISYLGNNSQHYLV